MNDEGWITLPTSEFEVLTEALQKIAAVQPEALAIIERNGFVFEDIGREPGNWQHLAFTLYTQLCEVESIARNALGRNPC